MPLLKHLFGMILVEPLSPGCGYTLSCRTGQYFAKEQYSMSTRNEQLMEIRNRQVPQGVALLNPAFITRASGAIMVDADGRELLDFAGGIGVNNVGHCHP